MKISASNIRFIFFILLMLLFSSQGISSAFAQGYPERIIIKVDGVAAERGIYVDPDSNNQRYVLFNSGERELAPEILLDDDQGSNIFVHDKATGENEIISVTSDEKQAHRGRGTVVDVSQASISEDGRYVVFVSGYVDLVPNDTNGAPDVFLRDRLSGTTERISALPDGTDGGQGFSYDVQMSPDGRFIAFYSWAYNLSPLDTSSQPDLYVYDNLTGILELASLSPNGEQSNVDVTQYKLSSDGKFIAFPAYGFPGVPEDNTYTYIRDNITGDTELLEININGNMISGGLGLPLIGSEGRYGAVGYGEDVYFFDRTTGTTEKISVAMDGSQADGSSSPSGISDDGRFVLFSSTAQNLTPDTLISSLNLFIRDRESGNTKLVNASAEGTPSNDVADRGLISRNGKYISFFSRANNLTPDDNNNEYDVFLTYNPHLLVNYAPVIDQISGSPNPLPANTGFNISASFADPESSDTHTALWEWGDGTTSTGTITQSNGTGNATGSHTYSADGDYTVVLTLTDSEGNKAFKSFKITDPTPPQTDYKWTKVIETQNSTSEDYFFVEKMAADSVGNKYLAGSWRGTVDFDPGPGTDTKTTATDTTEMYITKINADDSYAWTKRSNQSANCQSCNGGVEINNLITDSENNMILIGTFRGTVDFDFNDGQDIKSSTSTDYSDYFIMNIKSDGSYNWTKTIPSLLENQTIGYYDFFDINMDSSGNIFIVGSFHGTADFDTRNGEDIHTSSERALYISKYNLDSTYAWTKIIYNGIWHSRIAFDSSNNIYITGLTGGNETIDFDPGPGTDLISNTEIFTTKLMVDGTYGWTETINHTPDTGGNGWFPNIAVDSENNVYISGTFKYKLDFDPLSSSDDIPDAGGDGETLFITKYNNNGTYGWTRVIQRLRRDSFISLTKLAVDSRNNVYVTSGFSGKYDFNPPSGNIIYKSGQVFITGYSKSGNYLGTKTTSATYAGGRANANNIVIDKNNNLYVSGEFSNKIDFNPYSGRDYFTGHTDQNGQSYFISKYDLSLSNQPPVINPIIISPTGLLTYVQASASTTFSDQDSTDTHSAVWEWGDGTTSSGVINTSNSTKTITGNHTYSTAGTYTVKLTVTDSYGNTSSRTSESITVNNPTPEQMADIIVDTVISADIPTNVENSYMANLKKVKKFIEDGKINSARNQLEAFINKVDKDYRDGLITEAQRDQFLSMANALLEDLD